MGPFKVFTTLLLQVQCPGQPSLLELSYLLPHCFSWRTYTFQQYDFHFRLLQQVYHHSSIWSIWPLPPMQRSQPTLANKHTTFIPPTSYLLPLYPPRPFMLLAVLLHLLLPFHPPNSLRVLQWNAGGRKARNAELFHFISLYLVDLNIQKSNLNSSSSFHIPGYLWSRPWRVARFLGLLGLPP